MRVDESLDEQRVQGCLNILCDIGGFGDVECEVLEPGHVVLAFNTSSAMRNPYGDLHGGFYMTVSDMAACMAVYTNASTPVTLQCNFNFCEGIHVNGQRVTVDARVLRKGTTKQEPCVFAPPSRPSRKRSLLETSRFSRRRNHSTPCERFSPRPAGRCARGGRALWKRVP